MLHNYWEASQVVLMGLAFAGILAYIATMFVFAVLGFSMMVDKSYDGITRRECFWAGLFCVVSGTLLLPLVRFPVMWMFMWRDSL